jgi:hypothetical protein
MPDDLLVVERTTLFMTSKMIPFNKTETNILSFRGSFNFHRALFRGIAIWVIKASIKLGRNKHALDQHLLR